MFVFSVFVCVCVSRVELQTAPADSLLRDSVVNCCVVCVCVCVCVSKVEVQTATTDSLLRDSVVSCV